MDRSELFSEAYILKEFGTIKVSSSFKKFLENIFSLIFTYWKMFHSNTHFLLYTYARDTDIWEKKNGKLWKYLITFWQL